MKKNHRKVLKTKQKNAESLQKGSVSGPSDIFSHPAASTNDFVHVSEPYVRHDI